MNIPMKIGIVVGW